MKKVVYAAISAALAALAYGVGKAEGNNIKEKATNFGLGIYAKGKALVEKVCPKEEKAPEAPAE